jgi:hypothetical protein
MKSKFQRALGIFILCVILLLLTLFSTVFKNTELNSFLKGFSAALATGSLISIIYYGRQLYLTKNLQ